MPADHTATTDSLPSPLHWKGRAFWGPVLAVLLAGILIGLGTFDIRIPNPVLFFVNIIVLSAFLGGTASGMASVAITLAFALIDWSEPRHLLCYNRRDVFRLLVLAFTMPPLALLVGWLRGAYDRNHDDIVDQRDNLARELKRRLALETTQRDVEHILRHDLRAPLTGIISIPSLLAQEDNLTTEQKNLLTMVGAVGRKMLGQINSSLELRRIEDGTYTLRAAPCDAAAIIRDNFNILTTGGLANTTPLHLIEQTDAELRTDGQILDSILANLLRNALEASDTGQPIVASLSREDDDYVISIHNNRPVPDNVRDRFFEKYATAGKVGGTGLGTYSAALMTRALHGRITMETSEETGTTVAVRLPLKAA